MSPVFRAARAGDADALLRIRTSVTQNALSIAELAAIGLTLDTLAAMLRDEPPRAWIAEMDGEPVGFSMVDRDAGCLFALFVLPSREGMGLGGRLLALAEEALWPGHEMIWLETAEASRACEFYRRHGWILDGSAEAGDVRMVKRRPAGQLASSSG